MDRMNNSVFIFPKQVCYHFTKGREALLAWTREHQTRNLESGARRRRLPNCATTRPPIRIALQILWKSVNIELKVQRG